jgi:hypothetical protein
MKILFCVMLAAGCTVGPRDYTGPTIRMELTSNDFDTVHDTTTKPSFELDTGDTAYSIEIEILTQSGGSTVRSSYTASDVGSVATRFTLAGADVPSPAFVREDVHLSPSFTSDQPLVIPASALGRVLTVHATAVDGNELASNVIDFAIELK